MGNKIKAAGCTRSRNVVTVHLNCTSIAAAQDVFTRMAAAIDGDRGEALVASVPAVAADAAPEVVS